MDCDTWPIPATGACAGGCTIADDVDPDVLAAASTQAGLILRTLSGQRVGTCLETIRPLAECPTCRTNCRCKGAGDRIKLFSHVGPVTDVTGVTVDGADVDAAGWRYWPSGQLLYRRPPDVWPIKDVKWADCGDTDTMCVDVVIGHAPDAWALSVHSELTCELIRSCTDGKCRLPKNATSVSSQGVSVQLSLEDIRQFIPNVAAWVAAVNPYKATTVTKVFSPDVTHTPDGGCGCDGGPIFIGGGGAIDGGWA